MTNYTIAFRDGPLHNKIVEVELEIKPGDTLEVMGSLYELVDSPTARMTYEDGFTAPGLACGALWLDPKRN